MTKTFSNEIAQFDKATSKPNICDNSIHWKDDQLSFVLKRENKKIYIYLYTCITCMHRMYVYNIYNIYVLYMYANGCIAAKFMLYVAKTVSNF